MGMLLCCRLQLQLNEQIVDHSACSDRPEAEPPKRPRRCRDSEKKRWQHTAASRHDASELGAVRLEWRGCHVSRCAVKPDVLSIAQSILTIRGVRIAGCLDAPSSERPDRSSFPSIAARLRESEPCRSSLAGDGRSHRTRGRRAHASCRPAMSVEATQPLRAGAPCRLDPR